MIYNLISNINSDLLFKFFVLIGIIFFVITNCFDSYELNKIDIKLKTKLKVAKKELEDIIKKEKK